MPQDAVFHRDFKPGPHWWEAYQPAAQDLLDVRIRVLGLPERAP